MWPRNFINDSPVQRIILPETEAAEVRLFIKRDDLLHPGISGNKWRKLKYNILELIRNNQKGIITLGGSYSNHLHAVSVAGKEFGFETVGIVRGEEPEQLSLTLQNCLLNGMQLHYVSRTDYRLKLNSPVLKALIDKYPEFMYIPEGGENDLAKQGCAEILEEIDFQPDFVCVSCGTGTTLAGILNSRDLHSQLVGFPVLKGAEKSIGENVLSSLTDTKRMNNLILISGYHFGGYAKYNNVLIEFILRFQSETSIPLDQVYTGKMMFGILDKIKSGYFPKGSTILAIHTGGLQGRLPSLL